VPNITTIIPQALQNFEGKTYGAGIHLGVRTITVDNTRIKSFIPDYNPSMLKSWTFLYRPELKNQISNHRVLWFIWQCDDQHGIPVRWH
jgi:hypothetical protein